MKLVLSTVSALVLSSSFAMACDMTPVVDALRTALKSDSAHKSEVRTGYYEVYGSDGQPSGYRLLHSYVYHYGIAGAKDSPQVGITEYDLNCKPTGTSASVEVN